MILKHEDEINKLPPIIDSLIEDDSNIHVELGSLAMNMKKEVREVIDSFLSFLTQSDERRVQIYCP
jgi:hypothetical protein